MENLARRIRDIPDFPKKGILFKDITPLLRDAEAFSGAIEALARQHERDSIAAVAAIESRGFILGGALAARLGAGFIPIRKPGKLPHQTHSETYSLEYGTGALEIHRDAVNDGDRVLVIDDLLATGGTARAAVNLVRKARGTVVAVSFLVELGFLNGRSKLAGIPVNALIKYDG